MNWRQIFDCLNPQERLEFLLIILKRVIRPRRRIRPVDLVFPAMFCQIIFMLVTIWLPEQKNFLAWGIAETILVAVCISPGLLPKRLSANPET